MRACNEVVDEKIHAKNVDSEKAVWERYQFQLEVPSRLSQNF